jgi:4-azaleucine resistance transporter AzlC
MRPRLATSRLRSGLRTGVSAGVATFAIGVAFGLLARPVVGGLAAIVMSLVVFAGSAQLTAVGVLASGGSVAAATIGGLLMNLRFLPMGVAAASAFRGRAWRRALEAQTLVDASWALALDDAGRVDRGLLIGATIPQAIGWWTGTAVGALGGAQLAHTRAIGLDAIFPAFFLVLLVAELRSGRAVVAAALAVTLVLVLTPHVPPGVPVVAAAGAAVLGLVRRP